MYCSDLAIAAYEWRGDTPRVSDTREVPLWLENLRQIVGTKRGDITRVADAAGMKLSQLQMILRGDNLKPQVNTLERIAQACGKDLVDLFSRPEEGTGHARNNSGEGSEALIEDHLAALISHFGKLQDRKARADLVSAITSLFTALEHTRPAAAGGSPEDDGR